MSVFSPMRDDPLLNERLFPVTACGGYIAGRAALRAHVNRWGF